MSLSGRKALVTGGGSGVGAVIAARLAAAGAEVTVCGRRPIDPPPRIRAEICDITDEAAVADLFARGPSTSWWPMPASRTARRWCGPRWTSSAR